MVAAKAKELFEEEARERMLAEKVNPPTNLQQGTAARQSAEL